MFSSSKSAVCAALLFVSGSLDAQITPKTHGACDHELLLSALRAYEDTLAAERGIPVERGDYALYVTDPGPLAKEYALYRCDALLDSLAARQAEVATARTPFVCGTSTVLFDGYAYATVAIGAQCFFAENLRSDTFRDGTPIPALGSPSAWTAATGPAQAIYATDSLTHFTPHGRLYNGHAAVSPAGLCPTGWHVPSDADWALLETHLGGYAAAGSALKTAAWGGVNSAGFTALASGFRSRADGSFGQINTSTYYWSSTPSFTTLYFAALLDTSGEFVRHAAFGHYNQGFSVRCLKD